MLVTWFAHNLGTYANLLAPRNADLIKGMEASQEKLAPEHKRGGLYIKISEDYGMTWSTPECIGVNGTPPHLLLHSSGALICSYGRRAVPYGERAAVSYDFGKTWADEYILDERPTDKDLGYPTTAELDDGTLVTVYYQKLEGDSNASLLCARWKLK